MAASPPGKAFLTQSQPGARETARTLVLDELFDLSLYRALESLTAGSSRAVLRELIRIEAEHLAFWQKFFDLPLTALDWPRRIKLQVIVAVCRLFGDAAIHLVLEAIEVHGVRKYLALWVRVKDQPLGAALRHILEDEFKHEDAVVGQLVERKINPEVIRNIFLGFNDGLVEILGAVSGFFGAFGNPIMVLIAASTTAVAGALSMGAGAYAALNSEQEVRATETARKAFLGEGTESPEMQEQPSGSALVVGGSYFLGAMVPVLPVLFGAQSAVFSVIAGATVIILVSTILAFLSGMDVRQRILTNLVMISAAVGVTFLIGTIANRLWGVPV